MGLLASLASGLLTNLGNIALSERQRVKNNDRQDALNQYNLPINQVKRLQDAGINPNSLSMASGMDVQGNVSTPQQFYQTPSLSDPMTLASNSFLAMQQGTTEQQMRQVRKEEVLANIEVLRQNAEKLGVDTQYHSILNTFAAAREQAAVQGQRFQNQLTFWQTAKVKQEARQLVKYIDEVMPEEIKKIVAEQKLSAGQLDQIIANIANIEADTSLKDVQRVNVVAQTDNVLAQKEGQQLENARYNELTDQILAQYQATINKIAAETGLTEQESFYYLYELARKYGIKFMGIPVPGQGGLRDVYLNEGIQKAASDKYGTPKPKPDSWFK